MGSVNSKRDTSPSLAGGNGNSNLYQNSMGHYGNSHLGYGQSSQQDPSYYGKYNNQQPSSSSISQ